MHASDKRLTEAGSAKLFVKGNGDTEVKARGILTFWLSKRTPFGFQKDSFWSVKGLLLGCKRTRFEVQKDSFFYCLMLILNVELKKTSFFLSLFRCKVVIVV